MEQVVRDHRARLIGALARWCGDVDLAEDALSDAVLSAVDVWRREPPADPVAWLVTAARNRVRDVLGSARVQRSRALLEDDAQHHEQPALRTDDSLALMLACAHPAIDPGVHAPLILQVAMGVPVVDIATALALPQATLAKRLVRAKQKIRDSRIAIDVPDRVDPGRIAGVLDAIYAAYAIDWLRDDDEHVVDRVADEAVHASQLLLAAAPGHAEVRGLAALLLYLRARRPARVVDGMLVPTLEQDTALWDGYLIDRAESLLRAGLRETGRGLPGPYELQAAIQSAHVARRRTGEVDWPAIGHLYRALLAVAPSKGARTAYAIAVANTGDLAAGRGILAAALADDPALDDFQPFHAATGELLLRAGEREDAVRHLERALELSACPTTRRYLAAKVAALG